MTRPRDEPAGMDGAREPAGDLPGPGLMLPSLITLFPGVRGDTSPSLFVPRPTPSRIVPIRTATLPSITGLSRAPLGEGKGGTARTLPPTLPISPPWSLFESFWVVGSSVPARTLPPTQSEPATPGFDGPLPASIVEDPVRTLPLETPTIELSNSRSSRPLRTGPELPPCHLYLYYYYYC